MQRLRYCEWGSICILMAIVAMGVGWAPESLSEVPLTAADKPAEGTLEPFLDEPAFETQSLFDEQRFPNVVVTVEGTVLATWGGRPEDATYLARRSEDGGETWGSEITITEPGFHGGGVTVNESNGELLAFVYAEHPVREPQETMGPLEVFRSVDDGQTWEAMDVTIHPDENGYVPAMHMSETGVTLRHGEHAGRLVRPARVYGGGASGEGYNTAIYSDDGGATWHPSTPFPAEGTGEGTVAELSDGRLYYNSRRHWAPEDEEARMRHIAWSDDSGETWDDLSVSEVLPDGAQHRDYGLMAGLVRLPVEGRDILLFSNIESPEGRQNGTVWASFDGGETWPIKRQVDEGAFAYSSMAAGRPGTPSEGWIYLLYETGGHPDSAGRIARFNLSWLLEGEPTGDGDVPELETALSPGKREITIPTLDIAEGMERHVVIAPGSEEERQGHANTVLMPDGETLFVAWCIGHGGPAGPLKRSDDGGLTWSERLDVPANWSEHENCPPLYRLRDPEGEERLFIFANQGPQGRIMYQAHSEDGGETWTPFAPSKRADGGILGEGETPAPTVMPFTAITPVKDGEELIGVTNIRRPGEGHPTNVIAQSRSADGGLTWSEWEIILDLGEPFRPCEPDIIRSPDGEELLMIMRENERSFNSWLMRSEDEGESWSEPFQATASVTMDRHQHEYAPCGRLVIVGRDTAEESPTRGHFVAWIGAYDDLVEGREGEYRVKLLPSEDRVEYPAIEKLPDAAFVATNTVAYPPEDGHYSVVSTRFTLEELDRLAGEEGV